MPFKEQPQPKVDTINPTYPEKLVSSCQEFLLAKLQTELPEIHQQLVQRPGAPEWFVKKMLVRIPLTEELETNQLELQTAFQENWEDLFAQALPNYNSNNFPVQRQRPPFNWRKLLGL